MVKSTIHQLPVQPEVKYNGIYFYRGMELVLRVWSDAIWFSSFEVNKPYCAHSKDMWEYFVLLCYGIVMNRASRLLLWCLRINICPRASSSTRFVLSKSLYGLTLKLRCFSIFSIRNASPHSKINDPLELEIAVSRVHFSIRDTMFSHSCSCFTPLTVNVINQIGRTKWMWLCSVEHIHSVEFGKTNIFKFFIHNYSRSSEIEWSFFLDKRINGDITSNFQRNERNIEMCLLSPHRSRLKSRLTLHTARP